jgi:histidine triad (HIT) family protein
MEDCIFCKIAAGETQTKFLHQDKEVVAFYDINPSAPTHVLVIPRRHIESLADVEEEDMLLVTRLISVASKLAREGGIAESGYRVVINSGREGGQVVPHLHLHLLGGRKLSNGLG